MFIFDVRARVYEFSHVARLAQQLPFVLYFFHRSKIGVHFMQNASDLSAIFEHSENIISFCINGTINSIHVL